MEERDKNALVGALLLVAGGIIGAGVAILFAPQSGRQTRRDIARYARKTKNRTGEVVDDFSDAVSDMVDAVGDRAADLLDRGKDLAGEVKKDILKVVEDGQARLEKQRTKLAKLISE